MAGWVIQLLVAVALTVPGVPTVAPEAAPEPEIVTVLQPSPVPSAKLEISRTSTSAAMSLRAIPIASRLEVDVWIEQYAGEYGVSAETLQYMARCESTFNPRAVNGPYAGIYQYSASSWSSNRKAMGEDPNPDLRFDAQEAIKTTAFIVSTRGGGMWPNCMPE